MARDRFVDFLEGAMRGGASAVRSYMQAKVNVAKARNQRELQQAQIAFNKERNALLKRQQDTDLEIAQVQADTALATEQERQQGALKQVEVTVGGQKYIAEVNDRGETTRTMQVVEGQENVAGTQADAQRDVAKIGADSASDVATIQSEAAQGVATTQGETQRDVAKIGADASTGVAKIEADAQRAVADIQRDIAEKGYASAESIALMETTAKRLGFNMAGVQQLNGDEWKRLTDMMSKVSQNKDMTVIREIKGGFVTAMQGFLDASQGGPLSQQAAVANSEEAQAYGFSMADMAIINGYQRMIDPGATVREGDVDALIASMAKSEQLRAFVNQYIGTGGRFDDTSRRGLAELVLNQYNANVDARSPALSAQMQDVLRASGLEARGFGMDFFNIPQRENRTIDEITQAGGDWATGIGEAAPTVAPEPDKVQPEGSVDSGDVPGPGGSGELPLMKLAELYKSFREQGMADEEIVAQLRSDLAKNGVPEAELESVIAQVKSRVDATGADTTIGQTELEMEEAGRISKVSNPATLEVADLDDPETYRALKSKYSAPGKDITEQEWNAFKGQVYQNLIDDGASEEVAQAFIAKLRSEIEGSDAWAADTDEEE